MQMATCTKRFTMYHAYIQVHSDIDLQDNDPKDSRYHDCGIRYASTTFKYCRLRHMKVMNAKGNLYKNVNHVPCIYISPQ